MNLVTGATGHIGNVLVRKLIERGEKVRALILPNDDLTPLLDLDIELFIGDVLHPKSLCRAMQGIDKVFHLAGLISIMPGQAAILERINVGGTANMLECAQKMGVRRFVYTSSIHALGCTPHGVTIDENICFNPSQAMGDYDKTKARASLLVLDSASKGMDTIIVCPTGVIGPFDYKGSEMGTLLEKTIRGSLSFSVDGAYDFVDVRDVAEGEILASEKGITGSTYILSGEYITIDDVLKTANQSVGHKSTILKVPMSLAKAAARVTPFFYSLAKCKPQFTPYSLETVCSNSVVSHRKATHELGYAPRSIRESIEDTIHWWMDHRKLAFAPVRKSD
jgi:dihydroflavonol-4-reductase